MGRKRGGKRPKAVPKSREDRKAEDRKITGRAPKRRNDAAVAANMRRGGAMPPKNRYRRRAKHRRNHQGNS